jgi:hypothetical protein
MERVTLFFSELFYFVAVLDLVDEDLGRLEAGNEMLVYDDGRVARNVARNFFLSLLIDKAPESPDIDIMSSGHGVLNNGKERFDGCGHICLVNAGFFSDLVNNVCFRHVLGCYSVCLLGNWEGQN